MKGVIRRPWSRIVWSLDDGDILSLVVPTLTRGKSQTYGTNNGDIRLTLYPIWHYIRWHYNRYVLYLGKLLNTVARRPGQAFCPHSIWQSFRKLVCLAPKHNKAPDQRSSKSQHFEASLYGGWRIYDIPRESRRIRLHYKGKGASEEGRKGHTTQHCRWRNNGYSAE